MKKILLNSLFVLLAMGFVPTLSFAQPTARNHEVLGGGSWFRPVGTGSGSVTVDGSYGYFFDPMWQVGVRQSYTLNHRKGVSDVWNAVTAPFINYHFNPMGQDANMIPYLGMGAGAVWNDDDVTGTLAPQAGLKFYLSRSTLLSVGYRYEWFFDELDQANDVQDAQHIVTFGFGYTWS